jgi:SAM-dependent methyltransferase
MTAILDLGCGTGERAKKYAQQPYIGVDIDAENIRIARARYPAALWIQRDIAELKLSDLPPVSHIVCTEVLEHIPRPERVFTILAQAARGTTLFLTVPHPASEKKLLKAHPAYWQEIGHLNFFTKEDMRQALTDAGYKRVCISRSNAALFFELRRLFRKKAPCIRHTYYENILSLPEKIFWQLFRTDLFSTRLAWLFPLWCITLPIAFAILNPLSGATWVVRAEKK